MPGGMVRVTVEGLEKAELLELDCGGSSPDCNSGAAWRHRG